MNTTCAVLGVDPGVRGGLAILRADGSVAHVLALRPDMGEREVVDQVVLAAHLLDAYGSNVCFFEKVGFKRGDGGKGSFTFGGIAKGLAWALMARGVNPRYVYPAMWQAALGCLTAGNKNVSKAKAQEMFPNEKITHAVADALLIAEYGRRRMAL